eukprot:6459024-Amphidinium_carterae.5
MIHLRVLAGSKQFLAHYTLGMLAEWLQEVAAIEEEVAHEEQIGNHDFSGGVGVLAGDTCSAMPTASTQSLFQQVGVIASKERTQRKKRSLKVVEELLLAQGVASNRFFGDGDVAGRADTENASASVKTDSIGEGGVVDITVPCVQAVKRGRMAVTEFSWAMARNLAHALADRGVTHDKKLEALAKTYLSSEHFVVASGVVLQKLLGMSASVLQQRLIRFACACFIAQHQERKILESGLVAYLPKPSLVCYFDAGAYDETPMKVLLKEATAIEMKMSSVSDDAPSEIQHGSVLAFSPKSQTLIAKVLQTKSSYGILLESSSGLFAVTGQSFIPLQSMSSTSAAVLFNSLCRNSMVSLSAESFKLKCRSICADRGPGNRKAEEMLLGERGPDAWASALFACDIHSVALCHRKSFEALMSAQVKGALHLALSLRVGNSFSCFRKALMIEIEPKLVIVYGVPDQEHAQYKKKILSLLLEDSAPALQDAIRLLHVVNGNWCRHGVVEHVWDPRQGAEPPRLTVVQSVCDAILGALASRKPRVYPKHRWTGFKASIADLCLLEACHGLLTTSYARFVKMLSHTDSEVLPSGHELLLPSHAQSSVNLPNLSDGNIHPYLSEVAGSVFPNLPEETSAEGDLSYSQLNAKDRREATEFLSSKPLGHLLLMGIAVNPLERLMHEHFKFASFEWERGERAEIAKNLMAGEPCKRVYRIEKAANHDLENAFMSDLKVLFEDASLWSIIPEYNLTLEFQALAFRLLSRIGMCVEQLLTFVHSQYPLKLFTLLSQPHQASVLAKEPKCMKDNWALRLLESFPNYDGSQLLGILRLQAVLSMVDISAIEAKHAALRRHVFAKSVQTWTLKFTNLSAEWVLQCHRKAPKPKSATSEASELTNLTTTSHLRKGRKSQQTHTLCSFVYHVFEFGQIQQISELL